GALASIGRSTLLIESFVETGAFAGAEEKARLRSYSQAPLVMALAFDLGRVGSRPISHHAVVAYDEIYAVRFLGQKLRPYWRRNGATAASLLQAAERDYPALTRRCEAFDRELMADLARQGGPRYARLAALAYRQALAGCGWAADA